MQTEDQDLKLLNNLSNLLDNKFSIPGTNFRFGLDGIIGLVPYVGDFAGFAVSGYLVTIMGAIPLLGDFFDLTFKSNRRNVELLKAYYAENPNRPNAKWSFGVIAFVLMVLFALLLVAVWKVGARVFGLLFS
jgi:hypothetical protein